MFPAILRFFIRRTQYQTPSPIRTKQTAGTVDASMIQVVPHVNVSESSLPPLDSF
jgi:hypothetical protein